MMISLELESEILRLHHAGHRPIGTLPRQLNIYHDTVRRVLTQAGSPPAEQSTRRSMSDPSVPFIQHTLALVLAGGSRWLCPLSGNRRRSLGVRPLGGGGDRPAEAAAPSKTISSPLRSCFFLSDYNFRSSQSRVYGRMRALACGHSVSSPSASRCTW